MPQLLVHDLDAGTLERLKQRARQHGRSLQGEGRAILEAAVALSMSEASRVAEEGQRKLAGGAFTDNVAAVRQDRDR